MKVSIDKAMHYITILRLEGELDAEKGGREVREAIGDELEKGSRKFLIDLQNVKSGNEPVGEIFSWVILVVQGRGHISFLHPSEKLKRILHSTQVDTVARVFEDEGKAVDSVAF